MNPPYQLTEEQAKDLYDAIDHHHSYAIPANEWLNANIPPPTTGLRPIEEMPAEVPEGYVRCYGRYYEQGWEWVCFGEEGITHFVDDRLPPLPRSPEAIEMAEFDEWYSHYMPSQCGFSKADLLKAWRAARSTKPAAPKP